MKNTLKALVVILFFATPIFAQNEIIHCKQMDWGLMNNNYGFLWKFSTPISENDETSNSQLHMVFNMPVDIYDEGDFGAAWGSTIGLGYQWGLGSKWYIGAEAGAGCGLVWYRTYKVLYYDSYGYPVEMADWPSSFNALGFGSAYIGFCPTIGENGKGITFRLGINTLMANSPAGLFITAPINFSIGMAVNK